MSAPRDLRAASSTSITRAAAGEPVQRFYALVVGVDVYRTGASLQGAVGDANAFAAWVTQPACGRVPAANLRTLIGDGSVPGSPSRSQFDAALAELAELEQAEAGAPVGARLYVYLAGHGIAMDAGIGAVMLYQQSELINESAQIDEYRRWLDQCRHFEEVLMFVDCCRTRVTGLLTSAPALVPCRVPRPGPRNHWTAFASELGSVALEETTPGPGPRGHFTVGLLDGLKGAAADPATGIVDTARLGEYLDRRVAALSLGVQRPDFYLSGRNFDICRLPHGIVGSAPEISSLVVEASDSPLARITVTRRIGPVLSGVGRLEAAVAPADFTVRVALGTSERVTSVKIEPYTRRTLEMSLQPSSAAPLGDTDTSHEYHIGAAVQASERMAYDHHRWPSALVVMLRAIGPMDPDEFGVHLDAVRIDRERESVEYSWMTDMGRSSPYAVTAVPTTPETHLLTTGHEQIAIPAWIGFQTLVFLPVSSTGPAAGLASIHTTPLEQPWDPYGRLERLTDQALWALSGNATLSAKDLHSAYPGRGPIPELTIAHLAFDSEDEEALQFGLELARRRHGRSTGYIGADDYALRWRAAGLLRPEDPWTAMRGLVPYGLLPSFDDSPGALVVDPPLFARSADALLTLEAASPGAISGRLASALEARLTSRLWMTWRRVDSSYREHFNPLSWRTNVERCADLEAGPNDLRAVLADVGQSDPALLRFTTFLLERASLINATTKRILTTSDIGELVRATGLPAVSLDRALGTLEALLSDRPPPTE